MVFIIMRSSSFNGRPSPPSWLCKKMDKKNFHHHHGWMVTNNPRSRRVIVTTLFIIIHLLSPLVLVVVIFFLSVKRMTKKKKKKCSSTRDSYRWFKQLENGDSRNKILFHGWFFMMMMINFFYWLIDCFDSIWFDLIKKFFSGQNEKKNIWLLFPWPYHCW